MVTGSPASPLKVRSTHTGQSLSNIIREACVGACLEQNFYLEPYFYGDENSVVPD